MHQVWFRLKNGSRVKFKQIKNVDDLIPEHVKAYNDRIKRKEELREITENTVIELKKRFPNHSEKKIKQAANIRTAIINQHPYMEDYFMEEIKYLNVEYIHQYIFLKEDTYYIVDFYFPNQGLVVEIDSDFHYKPDDDEKDEYLIKTYGVDIIRIEDDQLENNLEETLSSIEFILTHK